MPFPVYMSVSSIAKALLLQHPTCVYLYPDEALRASSTVLYKLVCTEKPKLLPYGFKGKAVGG